MIVELALGAGLIAAGLAYRSLLERRGRAHRARPDTPRVEGRGLRVADVILYADTELWLAGCFELAEQDFVIRLFRAPGNRRAPWVLQLDDAGRDLALAHPTEALDAGAVPSELRLGSRRYVLTRRATVSVRRQGEELPPSSLQAALTWLTDPGGFVLVVVDFRDGTRLALEGERVSPEMLQHLPGA